MYYTTGTWQFHGTAKFNASHRLWTIAVISCYFPNPTTYAENLQRKIEVLSKVSYRRGYIPSKVVTD